MRSSSRGAGWAILLVGSGLLAGCSDSLSTPTAATATAGAATGNCGSGLHVTANAPSLVLAPGDPPTGMHQVSAQPLKLGSQPAGVPLTANSYEVVFTDAANSRRIVSQAVVADSATNASLLFDGTTSGITANGGTLIGPAPLCDRAEISTVEQNGKRVFVAAWHHGNVFAEVLDYRVGVTDAVVEDDLTKLATTQDARIVAAATSASASP